MLDALKAGNLLLLFLLELGAWIAVGYWGFTVSDNWILKIVLGIGAPLLMIVLWGTFASPRAPRPVSKGMHVVFEVLLFGLGALALVVAGQPLLGLIFAVLALISSVLTRVWKNHPLTKA